MRVILVNPDNNMPYGLMYIASYLRKYAIYCQIVPSKELTSQMIKHADIIGISDMFTMFHTKTMQLAAIIKGINKSAKVVIGGNHASIEPEKILATGVVDHVVVGEGEQAFLDICRGEKASIVHKPLLDISSIPRPAYDLVDVEGYIENRNPFSMRSRTMGIISSRGCPNNCTYCSIVHVWGRSWRGRSPFDVVDEIEFLKKTYNVHEFSFLDDSMSIDKQRLYNICLLLINNEVNIKWTTPNGIAHWTLDKELLDIMKKSGCYRITFGIESASPKIRESIRKNYSLTQAKEIIRYANKIGLWTITTNIIGLPFEEESDVEETLKYAIDCDTDFACFYTFIPHIGTDAYASKDNIRIPDDRLLVIQRELYRKFLLSRLPAAALRVTNKVHSFEDAWYVARLLRMGAKVLLNTFKQGGHVIYG